MSVCVCAWCVCCVCVCECVCVCVCVCVSLVVVAGAVHDVGDGVDEEHHVLLRGGRGQRRDETRDQGDVIRET